MTSLRVENESLEKIADAAAKNQKKLEQQMKALVKDNKRKEHELQTLQHEMEQVETNHKVWITFHLNLCIRVTLVDS